MIMMGQCRFIKCNKLIILVEDADGKCTSSAFPRETRPIETQRTCVDTDTDTDTDSDTNVQIALF